MSSAAFFEAVKGRRSVYALEAASTVPDSKLKEIVESAVLHAPSSFNSQSGRAVLVTADKHKQVWDIISETAFKAYPAEMAEAQKGRVAGSFKPGYGTVLVFEDQEVINGFSAKMPALAQLFPVWSGNSTGMLQYIIWTALEAEGMGASLQHHLAMGAEVQAEIAKALEIPATWTCTALIPFGKIVGDGGLRPKEFSPIENRVKFFTA